MTKFLYLFTLDQKKKLKKMTEKGNVIVVAVNTIQNALENVNENLSESGIVKENAIES